MRGCIKLAFLHLLYLCRTAPPHSSGGRKKVPSDGCHADSEIAASDCLQYKDCILYAALCRLVKVVHRKELKPREDEE